MYAVIRVQKLKTMGEIAAMGRHNERARATPNADPDRLPGNQRLLGTGDWAVDVQRRLEAATYRRPDAVLCLEHVLTASPEFFDGDQSRLDRWIERSMGWLVETYGRENVVAAVVHLDEMTPHIQAAVVPIDDRQHLNAKQWTGGAAKLSALQDSYHAAVADLGLERGIRGSVADHQTVKAWYAKLEQPAREAQEIANELEVERPPLMRRDEWAQEKTAEIRAQIVPTYEIAATQAAHWRERAERAEATMQHQAARLDELRTQTEQLRAIDLTDVVERLGGNRDRHDRHKWLVGEDHVSINGQKFYNHDQQEGGGGAIDLVRHVTGYTFREAVAWLRDNYGAPMTTSAVLERARPAVERSVERAERPRFKAPERREEHWAQVRAYLVEQRRLPAAVVDSLHQQGQLYADARRNAVFLRWNDDGEPTGGYLRGTAPGSEFKGLVAGTRREAGYFRLDVGEDRPYTRSALVLVESPIDAISYVACQVRPEAGRTFVISTDGVGALPEQEIRRAHEQGWAVVSGFDRDAGGERLAERVQAVCPDVIRERPPLPAKDWAELVQARSHLQEREPERESALPHGREQPARRR